MYLYKTIIKDNKNPAKAYCKVQIYCTYSEKCYVAYYLIKIFNKYLKFSR